MRSPVLMPNRHRRRIYVLDRPTQSSVAWSLLLVLGGVGALYAFAVYFLMGPEAIGGMTVEETRRFLLIVHVAYFAIGGAIVAVAALLLTHRFVGPAYVMRLAIQAMRRGDYGARLTLRRRDYHKVLAQELADFRSELVAREAHEARLLQCVEVALDAGDLEAARAALRERIDAGYSRAVESAPIAAAS